MHGTIICGVTDTPEGLLAAHVAQTLGERMGMRVVLAHAVDGVPGHAEDGRGAKSRYDHAERTLAAIAFDSGRGAHTRICVAFGEPAHILADVADAEDAALVVLGASRAGFRGRRLRSDLAAALAAATRTPIVVVPPQTAPAAERGTALAEPPMAG